MLLHSGDTSIIQNIGGQLVYAAQTIGQKKDGTQGDVFAITAVTKTPPDRIHPLIRQAFAAADTATHDYQNAGSTAVLAYLSTEGMLDVAHVSSGTSHLIIRDTKNDTVNAINLTPEEHRLSNPVELTRVREAGGITALHDTVIQNLNQQMSQHTRAFGKKSFPGIIADPGSIFRVDITAYDTAQHDLYLLVASDGMDALAARDEYMRNRQFEVTTAQFLHKNIHHDNLAEAFLKAAHDATNKGDNITVIVLPISPSRKHDVVINICDGHWDEGPEIATKASQALKGVFPHVGKGLELSIISPTLAREASLKQRHA